MDEFDDLDRYNGDTDHDMWVDYTHYEYTGEGPDPGAPIEPSAPGPGQTQGNRSGCSAIFLLAAIVILVLVCGFRASAQKVYETATPYSADVKVYVTDKDYKADMIVCPTDHSYQARKDQNKGIWYFTDAAYQADKKIHFVDRDYKADLIIFFTDKPYRAGWRHPKKKHLME